MFVLLGFPREKSQISISQWLFHWTCKSRHEFNVIRSPHGNDRYLNLFTGRYDIVINSVTSLNLDINTMCHTVFMSKAMEQLALNNPDRLRLCYVTMVSNLPTLKHLHIYIYFHVYIYICVCMCVYIYMCICIYMYMAFYIWYSMLDYQLMFYPTFQKGLCTLLYLCFVLLFCLDCCYCCYYGYCW